MIPPTSDQRGAAGVLVVAMTGVLLLVGAAAGVGGAHGGAPRPAPAAPHQAARARAAAHPGGGGDACQTASGVAAANGGELRSCSVLASDVLVEVVVTGPRWLGQDEDLVGTARAGPG